MTEPGCTPICSGSQDALNLRNECVVGERHRFAFGGYEVLELAFAGSEFALADDQGDAEFFAIGILQLLAQLRWLGINLNGNTGVAQRRGKLEVICEMGGVEVGDKYLCRSLRCTEHVELFHRGE